MYRFLAVILLVMIPFISSGQNTGDKLRTEFNQQYDSGRYEEALQKANALIAYWKAQNQIDSTAFYQYRHAHTLGVMGMPTESVEESGKLIAKLEGNQALPSFTGGLYFTYGSNLLYLSEFSKAKEMLNKSIAFEGARLTPDTLILAKATEWKGLVCIYTDELDQSRRLVEEALQLRYAIFDSTAKEIAYNLNSLASVYDEMGLKAEAGKAYEEAYRILQMHLPADHPQLLSVASNLSIIKSDMGQISEALALLENAIAIHEKQHAAYSLMNEYHNMGSIYSMLEDYDRARIYLSKGLNLADSLLPNPHFYRANMYDGLGGCWYAQGNYMKADSLFYLSLQQREAMEEKSEVDLAQSTFNLAMTAQDRKDTARARNYYQESYEKRHAVLGINHPKTANSLYGLADIEWALGNHADALDKYRTCLNIYSATVTDQHQWTLENNLHLAERFYEINEPDSTSRYIQKSWEAICNPKTKPLNIQKLSQYPVAYVDPFVLKLIDFHLSTLLSKKHLITENSFEEGVEVMKTMDGLMEQLWPLLNFENENNSLLPLIKDIYREGVLLAGLKPNAAENTGLYLNSLEQSRSASIRSALQNRHAMRYANVPDSVVEQDRQLREELRFAQAKARDQQDEYWNKLRFETVNRWRSYQKMLHETYPEWYEVRYAPTIPSIEEVQKNLTKSKSSLVAYFDADTALVVMIADSRNFKSTLLHLPASWQDSVRTYRTLIEERADAMRIASLSYYLYSLLWQPIEENLKSRVEIIPDGILNYLNFETLISSLPTGVDFENWEWLLKKHTFILRNSLPGKIQEDRKDKNNQLIKGLQYEDDKTTGTGILAIAPGFSDELKTSYRDALPENTAADTIFTNWVQTPWSVEFAEELKTRGKVLTGSDATEKSFRENAATAGILHFGTHARLQDANPLMSYLALTPTAGSDDDGYLYAYELYNQPLHANLSVLTACETGLGAYREGDGVMSLAHAFQYAGCPNVVYSLWQIDDKQSTWIIKSFYEYIEDDMAYADALRQAKLDYLENHGGELSAPYYWGGVVITGEDGKIQKSPSLIASYAWPVGLAMGAMGLLVFYSMARKRNNTIKNAV
ncbi:CHAT domain-containing protein [Cryomorpha ignava]|uniref:CHAT domain-containing protein n=1 Tax=Cryomorpha ignava TaxID=101383 RepID=A0A7K3WVQ1_9FLAO|nr:CHAT domain-containing tetratricopeptide repeat protein [Cryomorpha ignava]NEN25131.1 CHAT domain-containing protein [Cryomorpha ignava]